MSIIQFLVVALALPASAPMPQESTERVTLRMRGKTGDRYAYSFGIRASSPGAEGDVNIGALYTERLTVTNPSRFVVSSSTGKPKFKSTGVFQGSEKAFTTLIRQNETVVLNDRGIPVPQKRKKGEEEAESDLIYPRDPVGVGSAWTAPVRIDGESYVQRYQLEKLANYRGRQAAFLRVTTRGNGTLQSGQEFWIDVATGRPLRQSGRYTLKEGAGSLEIEFDLQLLRAPFPLTSEGERPLG